MGKVAEGASVCLHRQLGKLVFNHIVLALTHLSPDRVTSVVGCTELSDKELHI